MIEAQAETRRSPKGQRRAKILFFTGVPVDDAATCYRSGLVARRLLDRGHKVIFASVSANFTRIEERRVGDLPVHFIGRAHYWAEKPFSARRRLGPGRVLFENVRTCFRFWRILNQERPDRVLVVTSMPISLMAGLVAKAFGFKAFVDIEDLVVGQMEAAGYPKFLVCLYDLIERAWVRIFDGIAVCSRYLAERYPNSVLLPNMIEVGLWTRLRRGFGGQERRVVFVGQMGPYHGQMEVLRNLAPTLRKDKNLGLAFVGGGEEEERLKIEVKKLKLEKQVSFAGQVSQNEVVEILATADIGLLPLWDTPVHRARHPLKLLEYLASGLVVITNRVGEAARQIKDGENGILCPPGDIDCLAQKTEIVLKSRELARRISKSAAVSVQGFAVEKILPKWIEFLEL